jgi:hypothetical protein
MGFKPRTSIELNVFHIKRNLKKLRSREINIIDCGLNKRFDRLKTESPEWFEDLHPQYIEIAKDINR